VVQQVSRAYSAWLTENLWPTILNSSVLNLWPGLTKLHTTGSLLLQLALGLHSHCDPNPLTVIYMPLSWFLSWVQKQAHK
jgi:hypothetical protein